MIRVSYHNLKIAAVMIYIFTFKFMQLSGIIYPFQSMNYILAIMALFLLLLGIYKQEGRIRIFRDQYNTLLILILLVIGINNADLKRGDIYDWLYYCISLLFFLLLRNDRKWMYPAVRFLVLCDIIYLCCTIFFALNKEFYSSCVIPILGFEYREDLLCWSRQNMAAGLFLHYTSNGIEMGLAVGIILYGINNKRRRAIIGILAFTALILTAKRSSFIAAALSLVIIYFLRYGDLRYVYKKGIRNIIMTLGAVATGAAIVAATNFHITLFQRFITDGDSGRSVLYTTAKKIFTNHILFGTGWDDFRFQYEALYHTNIDVHNVYLQLLCETGIVGFTVFFVFQVSCLIASIRLFRKSRYIRLTKSECGILCVSIYIQLFYHISNCFENLLYSYSTFSIYLMACVMVINLYKKYEFNSCYLSAITQKENLSVHIDKGLRVERKAWLL